MSEDGDRENERGRVVFIGVWWMHPKNTILPLLRGYITIMPSRNSVGFLGLTKAQARFTWLHDGLRRVRLMLYYVLTSPQVRGQETLLGGDFI